MKERKPTHDTHWKNLFILRNGQTEVRSIPRVLHDRLVRRAFTEKKSIIDVLSDVCRLYQDFDEEEIRKYLDYGLIH